MPPRVEGALEVVGKGKTAGVIQLVFALLMASWTVIGWFGLDKLSSIQESINAANKNAEQAFELATDNDYRNSLQDYKLDGVVTRIQENQSRQGRRDRLQDEDIKKLEEWLAQLRGR